MLLERQTFNATGLACGFCHQHGVNCIISQNGGYIAIGERFSVALNDADGNRRVGQVIPYFLG